MIIIIIIIIIIPGRIFQLRSIKKKRPGNKATVSASLIFQPPSKSWAALSRIYVMAVLSLVPTERGGSLGTRLMITVLCVDQPL